MVAEETGDCEAVEGVVVASAGEISGVGIGAEMVGGGDNGSVQRESGLARAAGPVLTRTTRFRHFEFGAKTP